ncbi:MAG: phage adaptor protein [Gammaproteobacteria bacterium]
MTTQDELIDEARTRLDDIELPYQFSTDRLERWLKEGLIEACRRSRVVVASDESISIVSGTSTYYLPENIYLMRRAKLDGTTYALQFTGVSVMDEDCPGWESHSGTPTHIITDMDSDKFTLYPNPDAADTLRFIGIKEPESINDMPARFRYGLVDWICYRAYQVKDADIEDRQKSSDHLALFEQEYGSRSSAKDEIFNLRQRPFNNFDGFY